MVATATRSPPCDAVATVISLPATAGTETFFTPTVGGTGPYNRASARAWSPPRRGRHHATRSPPSSHSQQLLGLRHSSLPRLVGPDPTTGLRPAHGRHRDAVATMRRGRHRHLTPSNCWD